MSSDDYEFHLKRDQMESLWDTEDELGSPFGEDMDDINNAIMEVLGTPPHRRRPRKQV